MLARNPGSAGPDRAPRRARLDRPRPLARPRLRSPLFGASDARPARAPRGRLARRELVARAARAGGRRPALARARDLLGRWQVLVAALPPHDLLDRIVAEGDVHARYAAAVPPEQRAFALDAIDAVLVQSLSLDGGRYATPYAFVRSLKKRALKAALPVRASTVRLLTVHGAKGLEADTVFVMDTEPERTNPATTTLLVEWPVEAERPTRCAFVYNENRCPPSLRAALDDELRAREREELNGLYVAMSRAKRRLVFSATEPYLVPNGPTWWSRVCAACSAAPPGQAELLFDVPAAVARARGAGRRRRHRGASAVAYGFDRDWHQGHRDVGGERTDRPRHPSRARMDRRRRGDRSPRSRRRRSARVRRRGRAGAPRRGRHRRPSRRRPLLPRAADSLERQRGVGGR